MDLPWLAELLLERDDDGQRRFDATTAEDFLAAVLLSRGAEGAQDRPPLMALLARFAARAGLARDADRAAAESAVARYFEQHPLPERLTQRFGQLYREDLLGALSAAADLALPKTKAPASDGPKGPLAYFAARAELEED